MMDVRCDKCSTEYEFEEDRVPADGLAVKCSQCGHVFRVYRGSSDQRRPTGEEWKVRQANGNLFSFRELTTLQRWIVERKVSRDDEISKTGKNWKRLGDIAELSTFFQVVEQAQQSATGPEPAMSPEQLPAAFSTGDTQPVPLSPAPVQPARPAGGDAWSIADLDPPTNAAFIVGTDSSANAEPAAVPATDPPAELPMDSDEFEALYLSRSGGALKWVLIVILFLVVGGAGGLWLLRPDIVDSVLGRAAPELAVSHVQSGYTELRTDSYAAIDRAIENFEKAVTIAEAYADAKAGLAEAELARAEWLAEEARDLESRLATTPEEAKAELTGKTELLHKEVDERAERAFNVAKEALLLEPEGLAANRAMADYYRFKGARDRMGSLIDRARAAAPRDSGTTYVIASGAAVEPEGREQAMQLFGDVLAQDADWQRARYKLAKLHHLKGDSERAIELLETLLSTVPDHERARALLLFIRPPEAPKPAAPEKAPPEAITAAKLIRQAERLRQADKAHKALQKYEQALEMEPGDPDGLSGIGWCYIDLEDPDAAIRAFKQILVTLPRFTDAHMGLGEAYNMKGMKRDAIKHYKRYLDILPNGPDAAVARRMLEALEGG